MELRPENLIDFYKAGHVHQYPKGTQRVFSNLTARGSRVPGINAIVFFGLQYFIKRYLVEEWNQNFFAKPLDTVVNRTKQRLTNSLGPNRASVDHIAELHKLQYLPLQIMAVNEGALVPLRIPNLVLFNTMWETRPEFFWLTNYIESILSTTVWGPCTSATTAHNYKKIYNRYADLTVGDRSFTQYQGHDFSFRGMFGLEAALMSGAAHLLSFRGSDTNPAIDWLKEYYNADESKDVIAQSVAATEHSVMCMSGVDGEDALFKRLITEVYPDGIVSIVSDTWNYWRVLTQTLPGLKNEILARNGKVVIRGDSSIKTPVEIICGDPSATPGSPEYKGTVELLWDTFGGTVSPKGFRLLDPHIGTIYGDSITMDRALEINKRLYAKGFASTNRVDGIGSFTYQYVTRDTFGMAMKATHSIVNGVGVDMFKNPITDSGVKASAKGLISVTATPTGFIKKEGATWDEVMNCDLHTKFKDGVLPMEHSLSEIRERLMAQE